MARINTVPYTLEVSLANGMMELALKLEGLGTRALDATDRVTAWQEAVEQLCAIFETELEPLRKSGVLLIDYTMDDGDEPGLGFYKTKGLGLRFAGTGGVVRLQAVGAKVVAARLPSGEWAHGIEGRVDLSFGAIRALLTRRGGCWYIAWDEELVRLDGDSLERALTYMLGV